MAQNKKKPVGFTKPVVNNSNKKNTNKKPIAKHVNKKPVAKPAVKKPTVKQVKPVNLPVQKTTILKPLEETIPQKIEAKHVSNTLSIFSYVVLGLIIGIIAYSAILMI